MRKYLAVAASAAVLAAGFAGPASAFNSGTPGQTYGGTSGYGSSNANDLTHYNQTYRCLYNEKAQGGEFVGALQFC
jgi:hypothetical protein